MAKGSRRRVARYQKDQSGCMWGLISIFDFRHGRSSQKLLLDRKRGSRRLDGAAYANIKLESLTDSCEICHDIDGSVQCETARSDISKLSVKELMDEEMLGEQDQKRQENIAYGEAKVNSTGDGGHVKKNRLWMKNKMSLDLDASGFVAAEDLKAGRPSHRKHKSCGSVDLNVIVEELCSRIHQKDTSYLKHGQDGEHAIQSTEDPSVIEKKLWESTKVLVNHFTDGSSCTKDGKIQPTKELTDALQTLNSNKDLFLKLLQDPSSQLVKHIQSLQDIQVEEGKFKVLTGSDMLQQDVGNAKQQNFWRRFKGLERSSSKKTDTSEDISRIVVLKPGPPSSNNSYTGTPSSSLPGSPQTTGDKGQSERAFSPFSFAEFKRKLKHAMRKEQHGLSQQPSDEQPNLANREKKNSGETIGMASPSRDHFFIERIPKTLVGTKKVDKTGNLKDDSALTPEQRVSNIYIEARKHLAEIVGNGDIDSDNPGKKRARSLGRILAYSGYNSPICSPRTEGGMRLLPNGECQTGDEKTSHAMQASNVSHTAQVKQESESEPCIAADKPIHEAEVPMFESRISDGLPRESNVDEPLCETEVLTSEVPTETVRSPDAESQKESDETRISSEQSSPHTIMKSEQEDSPSICSEKNLHPTSLKQDFCEENEPSSSSNASALICKVTEHDDDLDTVSDATSRPSPISVLEPLFQEDDISPPGIKYSNEHIRPRQIQFGEEISAPLERVFSCRTCVNDNKYTIEFVKAVVQMSGLTWDELLRRSILSDHLIDPSLLDEVDFLPDLLSCDFNVLFDLINEVLIEICCLNFGCLLSLAMPYVQPELKGKDVFTEIWKRVDWYLKLEGPPRTLDQIIAKDLEKPGNWMDLQLDCQCIGIQMQEAILEELVEETILSFDTKGLESDISILLPAEAKESDVNVEV